MPGLPHEPEVGAFVERACADSLRERRNTIADALGARESRVGSEPELVVEAREGAVREAAVTVPPTDPQAESAFDPVTLPHTSTNAPAYTEVVRTTTQVRKRRAPLLALAIFSACAALAGTALRAHHSSFQSPAKVGAATPLPAFLPIQPPAPQLGSAKPLARQLGSAKPSGAPVPSLVPEPSPLAPKAVTSATVASKPGKPKAAKPQGTRSKKPRRDTKHAKLLEQYGI